MNGIVTLGECPKTALKHVIECTNMVHNSARSLIRPAKIGV